MVFELFGNGISNVLYFASLVSKSTSLPSTKINRSVSSFEPEFMIFLASRQAGFLYPLSLFGF